MMGLPGMVVRIAAAAWLALAGAAAGHEVQPSVADVEVGDGSLTMALRTAVEPLLAGVDLGIVTDTDDSPFGQRSDRLRALPPDALEAALREAWPDLSEGLTIRSGGRTLAPVLADVAVPPVGDVALRRDSLLTVTADLPPGDAPVTIGWAPAFGGLIVRQGEEEGYEAFLTDGAVTDPLPRAVAGDAAPADVVQRYVVAGFDHIVPRGLDHVLFVLGLFFYAFAWRPLLWQVAAFTLGHTVTLALATLGIVQVPPAIVEPLIAASIVWIAVENMLTRRGAPAPTPARLRASGPAPGARRIGWTRIAVVFGFGLLHGLGFASGLAELGPGRDLVASLVSFNVGVELGQLAVIAFAALLVGLPFGREPWYRTFVANPASGIIGAVGLYWLLERTILA